MKDNWVVVQSKQDHSKGMPWMVQPDIYMVWPSCWWRPAAAPRTSSILSHHMRSHAAGSISTRDNIGCLLQWQLEDEISGLRYSGNQRPNPAPRKFTGLLLPPAIVSGTALTFLQHPTLHLCCKQQSQLPSSLRYDEQASGHPSSLHSPAPVQKPAPGTAPRSSLVPVCHLPCTTANPISSSFLTQVSSNWKYWEFWLACCVIEKYYGKALNSCCEIQHMPKENVRYSCSFPYEVIHDQGTAKLGENMGKSCPSQVAKQVWTFMEKPLCLSP